MGAPLPLRKEGRGSDYEPNERIEKRKGDDGQRRKEFF